MYPCATDATAFVRCLDW